MTPGNGLTITGASFAPKGYAPQSNPLFAGYGAVEFNHVLKIRDISVINHAAGRTAELPTRPYRIPCHRCKRPIPWSYAYCPRCGAKMLPAQEALAELPDNAHGGYFPVVSIRDRDVRQRVTEAVLAAS